jgi:hypothetical protein
LGYYLIKKQEEQIETNQEGWKDEAMWVGEEEG